MYACRGAVVTRLQITCALCWSRITFWIASARPVFADCDCVPECTDLCMRDWIGVFYVADWLEPISLRSHCIFAVCAEVESILRSYRYDPTLSLAELREIFFGSAALLR